ncbi:MAG: porin [Nannocystaceae bacterium]|nr:porin [Nannocystaceae bacterium]
MPTERIAVLDEPHVSPPTQALTPRTPGVSGGVPSGLLASNGVPTTTTAPTTLAAQSTPEPDGEIEPPKHGAKWTDKGSVSAFADAYAGVNMLMPSPATANSLRAFDTNNGFSLHWAGIDAEYDGDVVGGAVSLRLGPSATAYAGSDASISLQYVKQAYARWKPKSAKGRLSVDLGKFDTLYGAEVADSQYNFNYTRGTLNWLGQPFFHTGLRANVAASDRFAVAAIAVNGWNNTLDNNFGKSGGLQFSFSGARFNALLGYMVGAENDREATFDCDADTSFDSATASCADTPGAEASATTVVARGVNRRLRHFADLVLAGDLTEKLSLVANADVGYDETIVNPVSGAYNQSIWYGASLGARYALTPKFATAARGEFYQDLDGFTTPVPLMLGTGTMTFEFAPTDMLVLKVDSRYDHANEAVFAGRDAGTSSNQLTFTLGAVIRTP